MGEFINIFRSLMIWIRSGSHDMRNRVSVIIVFEQADDLAYARNRLKKDFKHEYTMFNGEYGSDVPIPVQCFGIPFELTLRHPNG